MQIPIRRAAVAALLLTACSSTKEQISAPEAPVVPCTTCTEVQASWDLIRQGRFEQARLDSSNLVKRLPAQNKHQSYAASLRLLAEGLLATTEGDAAAARRSFAAIPEPSVRGLVEQAAAQLPSTPASQGSSPEEQRP